MVKDAGGGDDIPLGPAIGGDQSSREYEEMGGDINAALCRDSDIDDIDNDTNESNDDVIITAACAETATASKELPKAVERAAMAANVVGCQPQPVTAAVAGAENCSTCR